MVSETHMPPGWRMAAFGECAVLVRDTVSPTNLGDMPYVGLEHVGEGTLSLASSGVATEVTSTKSRFTSNDVLFGKLRPYLRKVARARFDGICSTDIWVVRPAEGVDAGYLFHVMASQKFVDAATRGSEGTKMPRAQWDFVSRIRLSLPPLEEQRCITTVLDSIDTVIEHTGKVIASKEQLRDSLLHELLTHGVPGWHKEWKEVRSLGTVPARWDVMCLGDVADVAFSSVDKKILDDELPVELCNYTDVFYNRQIRPGMDLMVATATPTECAKWTLKKDDVLFTKDSETQDEIGIPAYVSEDMPNVLCGYHLGRARPNSQVVNGSFLTRVLGSPASAREFARVANGITRFGLTLDATRSLPVLLPPLGEQRAIASTLDGIDTALEQVHRERVALRRLKASTADALLTGCLRIALRKWS